MTDWSPGDWPHPPKLIVRGAPDNPYLLTLAKYDYAVAPCSCALCDGLGIPWGGWMRCTRCGALHEVEGGRVLVPDAKKAGT